MTLDQAVDRAMLGVTGALWVTSVGGAAFFYGLHLLTGGFHPRRR